MTNSTICAHCLTRFEALRKDAIYCGGTCRKASNRRAKAVAALKAAEAEKSAARKQALIDGGPNSRILNPVRPSGAVSSESVSSRPLDFFNPPRRLLKLPKPTEANPNWRKISARPVVNKR